MKRVTEVTYYPTGYDATSERHRDNVRSYEIKVQWHGEPEQIDRPRGGYGVQRGGFSNLSRAGKWTGYVSRFQAWQYRWATLEEACAAAAAQVDTPLRRTPGHPLDTWLGYLEWSEVAP